MDHPAGAFNFTIPVVSAISSALAEADPRAVEIRRMSNRGRFRKIPIARPDSDQTLMPMLGYPRQSAKLRVATRHPPTLSKLI